MKMQYFTEQHAGQSRKVLFEKFNKNGMMEGYTDNYIDYYFTGRMGE
jgi:threonylcarbamoyladenosine tRNA methylthiotransferase MtaB